MDGKLLVDHGPGGSFREQSPASELGELREPSRGANGNFGQLVQSAADRSNTSTSQLEQISISKANQSTSWPSNGEMAAHSRGDLVGDLWASVRGQLSTDEMPRNKFRRQFLYVSDAQYLTSNVDLSRHYERKLLSCKERSESLLASQRLLPIGGSEPLPPAAEAANTAKPTSDSSAAGSASRNCQRLNENIRLAISDMLDMKSRQAGSSGAKKRSLKEMDLGSSAGSSADSGVFPNGHSSSSSSSSSSTSSLDAEDVTGSDSDSNQSEHDCDKCAQSLYRLQLEEAREVATRLGLGERKRAPEACEEAGGSLEFGQCALDWHKDSHKLYHKNRLVALISAGMTTGSDKKYVTDTVANLIELGYECCVFIRRGVGGLKLSSAKFFSPAKWRDFEAAVQSIRQQRPNAHLVAVGFSFGSIELCRYLSMSGQRSLVDAALLISCPFDPEAGGRNMRKRLLNRKIDAYLAKNLAKQLYQAMESTAAGSGQESPEAAEPADKESQLAISNLNGSLVNLAQLPHIKSLVEFEDNFNRVLQNYPSSEAYADDSRLSEHLQFIETPTLCLSSEDDFMAPAKLLPLAQIEANENLCMLLTKRGGHMAFIDGLLWPKRPYFAQRIIRSYLGAVRSQLSLVESAPPPPPPVHSHKNHLKLHQHHQIQI